MWIFTGVVGGVSFIIICFVFYRVIRHPHEEEPLSEHIIPEPPPIVQGPITVNLDDEGVSGTMPTTKRADMDELPFETEGNS